MQNQVNAPARSRTVRPITHGRRKSRWCGWAMRDGETAACPSGATGGPHVLDAVEAAN
jgi:hypothetical protein